jgi:peptidoglycan pentaglycine glycine transferase (the first glycine)
VELLDRSDENQCREYEEFVNGHRWGSFTQSLGWCGVKNGWDSEVLVLRDKDGKIRASMLVLVKRVPLLNKTLLYAPRGPVCDPHDYATVSEMLEDVKQLARVRHAFQFKMDPYVMADDEEFIRAMRELGFSFRPGMKELTTIQTRNNYMLNIEGKTEEEVFAGFHPKWRYNIRLAQRKGVECRVCDKSNIDDFYELMKITGDRDRFLIRPKEYFVRMLDNLGEHCRLYICYYQGKALSGAVATQYGGKTCYVYGASSNEMRKLMPNYLMQWTMIQWAVQNHCFLYDFQGIPHYQEPDHPNYGVYRFKNGFRGQVVELAGEFNYVFSPVCNLAVNVGKSLVRYLFRLKKRLVTTGQRMPREETLQEKSSGRTEIPSERTDVAQQGAASSVSTGCR